MTRHSFAMRSGVSMPMWALRCSVCGKVNCINMKRRSCTRLRIYIEMRRKRRKLEIKSWKMFKNHRSRFSQADAKTTTTSLCHKSLPKTLISNCKANQLSHSCSTCKAATIKSRKEWYMKLKTSDGMTVSSSALKKCALTTRCSEWIVSWRSLSSVAAVTMMKREAFEINYRIRRQFWASSRMKRKEVAISRLDRVRSFTWWIRWSMSRWVKVTIWDSSSALVCSIGRCSIRLTLYRMCWRLLRLARTKFDLLTF